MKIKDIRLSILSVPLRVPFKTALRSVSSVQDVVVEILTDSGETGFGEAPPTGVITGDTTGAIAGAIRDYIAPKLIGRDIEEFETLLKDVQAALVHNTSAKAAVDIALWDLYGKHLGLSVFRLLGAARREIETDITISVNDPETNTLKEQIRNIIKEIDGNLQFHDFRIVKGPTHTNLLFDVLVPYKFPLKDSELIVMIDKKVKELNPTYFIVVKVDHTYI